MNDNYNFVYYLFIPVCLITFIIISLMDYPYWIKLTLALGMLTWFMINKPKQNKEVSK